LFSAPEICLFTFVEITGGQKARVVDHVLFPYQGVFAQDGDKLHFVFAHRLILFALTATWIRHNPNFGLGLF